MWVYVQGEEVDSFMAQDEDFSQENPGTKTSPRWLALLQVGVGNLVPLLGLIFLRWDPGCIVFVYWVENVLEGFFCWLSFWRLRKRTGGIPKEALETISTNWKITAVHGGFALYILFALKLHLAEEGIVEISEAVTSPAFGLYFWLAVLGLAVSRLLGRGIEMLLEDGDPMALASVSLEHMGIRIIVLHLTIIFGVIATFYFERLGMLVAIFVVLKAVGDVVSLYTVPRRALSED